MALKIKLSPNHIEFLKLLQKSRRDKHGKFCLSCYDKNWKHPCQLFNANPFKLFQYADLSHNIYVSENQFSRNKRSKDSLEDLDNIFCDCDCTKFNIPPQKFLHQLPQILKLAHLPQPCVKFSGHGFHLVYVISQIICRPNTRRGANLIQYWQNTEEYTINKINQACYIIFHKSPVDLAVHDGSRVLRLADTNNIKSKPTRSYWIFIAKHIYELKDFWQGKQQFPHLYNYYRHNFKNFIHYSHYHNHQMHQTYSNKKHSFKKYQSFKQRYKGKALIKKNKQLGNSRMNWLINAFYNQRHQHLQGNRDLYLFILAREASKAYPSNTNKTIHIIRYINNQIKPNPLEPKGLNKIIKEVQDKYDNAKIEKYNYTTPFICKLLHIEPTYENTRKIYRQNQTKIHSELKFQQDEKAFKKIYKYKKQHKSIASIARIFHKSRHYIYNVIRRHRQVHKNKHTGNNQEKEQKHLSQLCHQVNTVESHSHVLFNNVRQINIPFASVNNYSINNYNSESHFRPFYHTSNYLKQEDASTHALYRQYRLIVYKSFNLKYGHKHFTDKQKQHYDMLIGNANYGQKILKSSRQLYKLKRWLITGKYKQLGFTKQQINQFIQRCS